MSSPAQHPGPAAPRVVIGERYELQRSLGQGGMAEVFEVLDRSTGHHRALKRLNQSDDAQKQRRSAQLFEREFHQLAQLAHPRVVQVHEYAIDEAGPWYTMELLDGGDLHELAPLGWRRACAIARDLCSALSLLHSRQWIHRDLSPRNVRCAHDGSAKLIDFGAMTAFGPTQYVVGTPACCAPEIVALQALDARTDLYALGATLYFMLTGRHAYPARNFAQLAELWREPLARPSQYADDVPEALDALVLNLLRLDPDARPGSAAEVMRRLQAIDGCQADEELLVAQAYLSTPTLVGRAKSLTRARARLKRVAQGKSSCIAIEGPSGVGRSRFLDACVLEATLLGLTVVRIGADQAEGGDWGLVRSITAELRTRMPEATLAAARPLLGVLGHALPELAARAPEVALQVIEPERLRPQLQHALRQWLLSLCAARPLLIAVDDLQRADDPSATLLALLACELDKEPLVLMAALETAGPPPRAAAACKLFSENSQRSYLRALEATDAEALLRSLFGDVPNVGVLAHRLWTLGSGNPRQIMRLAQHLIDQGLVQYHAGAWSLPVSIDTADLPLSPSHAQRARIAALSPHANALASALALCPDLDFTPEECASLIGIAADGGALDVLDELRRAEILRDVRDRVALSHPTWGAQLERELTPQARSRRHFTLAQTLSGRSEQAFRVGAHLLLAGDEDRALDVLVAHAEKSQEETAQSERVFFDYVRSLPPDWLMITHRAIQLCGTRGRPRRDRYQLLSRLAGILAMLALDDKAHMAELMRELAQDSGLADWAALDASLEGMPRLVKALEQTQARYDATPERERVLDPLNAIKQLARGVIAASGVAAMSMDVHAVRALPSLVPLIPLSPALALIQLLTDGMCARYTGRFERACDCYAQILERTGQPDRGGLDAAHSGFMRMGVMNGVGMIEAGLGRPRALEYAGELEREPSHRVNALQIRMLHQLWQGDGIEAERYKRSVDRVRIENSARHWFEGSHLLWEVAAYAICDDVMHLKHVREELASLARRYDTWRAVDQYASAQYQYACGDYRNALVAVEQGLALAAAGEHQIWVQLAAAHVRCLLGLGRGAEALALAERYLASAQAAELGYQCEYLRLSLSLAQAKQADEAAAISGIERTLETFTAAGITGLNLGLVHETRARVALTSRDAAAFEQAFERASQIYRAYKYPPLAAKCDRWLREARRLLRSEAEVLVQRSGEWSPTKVTSVLETGRTPEARASMALSLLLEHSHASGGYLFSIDAARGAQCIARSGDAEPPVTMLELVREFVAEEQHDGTDTTSEGDDDEVDDRLDVWRDPAGHQYRPVMLGHYVSGELVISGVAVLDVADDAHFVYPGQLAADLSKFASRSGETTLVTQLR